MASTEINEAAQALAEGDLPTHWLARVALECWTRDGSRPLWRGVVADTAEDAREYYAGLDEQTLRWEAAEALALGGWNRSDVCRKHS